MSDAGVRDSRGLLRGTGTERRRQEISFHYCTRVELCSAISVVLTWSLKPRIPRMYRATRCACRLGMFQALGAFGKGRNSDKDAVSEFQSQD